eukprot:scaffold27068_cov62-Phaeocystis_antarctica.AAC.3
MDPARATNNFFGARLRSARTGRPRAVLSVYPQRSGLELSFTLSVYGDNRRVRRRSSVNLAGVRSAQPVPASPRPRAAPRTTHDGRHGGITGGLELN